jgi:hypothetical protein
MQALTNNTSASGITAVGYQAGYTFTGLGGSDGTTFVGYKAGYNTTTGINNTAVGSGVLFSNTTGDGNSAFGINALYTNTTADNSTALGFQAAFNSNTNGVTAVGAYAGHDNTTGAELTAFGYFAAADNTTGGYNVATGPGSLRLNTTGLNNTSMGFHSLYHNTVGRDNVAVGYHAMHNQTGSQASYNTAVGYKAGENTTSGNSNTFIGYAAGTANTTGLGNVFVGSGRSYGSGGVMTTGSDNTIIGTFSGNNSGLDIRTASNRVVISDGSGAPRYYINHYNEHMIGHTNSTAGSWAAISTDPVITMGGPDRSGFTSSMYARVSVQERQGNWISFVSGTPQHYGTISRSGSGVSYGSNSDYRLKENIVDLTDATTRLKQLEPKRFNFIDNPDTTTDGFLAHEVQAVVPEAVTGTHNGTVTSGNVEDAEGNLVHKNVKSDIELAEGETFVEVKTEPEYQQLDPAKLVPLLTAALQEAITKIEQLEARVATLEG